MTKLRLLAVIACLVATACGGGGDGGTAANAAAAKSFTYGAATSAPAGAADGAAAALAGAAAFSPGSSGDPTAVNGALFAAADAALGDSAIFAVAPVADPLLALRRARSRALALGGPIGEELGEGAAFPPGCYVAGGNAVTFSNCTITETMPDGTLRVTVDGTVSGAPGSVAWDLVMTALVSVNSPEGAFTVNVRYDDAGTFAVTATTARAHQEVSLDMHAQANGESARLRVAQAADLDATIAPAESCSTRITGGTFEAKRVWTEVPREARDEPEFRDRGVKLGWTGCGAATAQFSAQ